MLFYDWSFKTVYGVNRLIQADSLTPRNRLFSSGSDPISLPGPCKTLPARLAARLHSIRLQLEPAIHLEFSCNFLLNSLRIFTHAFHGEKKKQRHGSGQPTDPPTRSDDDDESILKTAAIKCTSHTQNLHHGIFLAPRKASQYLLNFHDFFRSPIILWLP